MSSETAFRFIDAPLVPLVPAAPDPPEVPLVPAAPDPPEVPLVPAAPDPPEVPLVPAAPDPPEVPEVPDVPPPPPPPDKYGKLFQDPVPLPIFSFPVSSSNPASPGYNVGFTAAQFEAVSLFS